MQIELPDLLAEVVIRDERLRDDAAFYEFCVSNSNLRIERSANGEVTIMPPTGYETGFRNSDINAQLTVWAKRDGRGNANDSSTGFRLPDGSVLAPDDSWVSKLRLQQFTKEQKRKFLPLGPEFVIELTSPSDRLSTVRAKMRQWMTNGVILGWLIDPDRLTVGIYRPGRQPEELLGMDYIDGESPVDGFRLDLTDIWEGA